MTKKQNKNKRALTYYWILFVGTSLLISSLLVIHTFRIKYPVGLPQAQAVADSLPDRLLHISDLNHQGSFTYPQGNFGGNDGFHTWSFGGWGITYNQARNSLIGAGHISGRLAGEMSIPAFGKEAAQLQPFADPTDGKINNIEDFTPANGALIGGFLLYGNKLITTAYDLYDANFDAKRSHFASGLDLSVLNDTQGPFTFVAPQAGFVAGYMTLVPQAWRAVIGAPAVTGLCCISIISRTSHGPGLFGFEPNNLGVKNPVPTIPLVYYPQAHLTLSQFTKPDSSNPYFNLTSNIYGVVWPENTRTVMFFGRHGLGPFCYGPTTLDPAQAGKVLPGNSEPRCWDPNPEQALDQNSTHSTPKVNYVWMYDALDFLAVKNGTKQPWEIVPYEVGTLRNLCGICTDAQATAFPYTVIRGATYDPATGRIFLSRAGGVEVFTIANPGALPAQSPTPTPSLIPIPTPSSMLTPTPSPTPVPVPMPILSPSPSPTPIATPTPTPDPYTICNNENGGCNFSGTRNIKYGTRDRFVILTFSNSVACTNQVFGDPAPGIVKSCYISEENVLTPLFTATPTVPPKPIPNTNQASITPAPRIGLMRTEESPKVYYITEKGLKRWIPTETVFNSYSNRWEDVVVVPKSQIDSMPKNILVKLPTSPRVYLIENGKKRWISTYSAFVRNGYGFDQVAPINQIELDYYKTGAIIK